MAKYTDNDRQYRYEVRDEAEQSIKDLNIDRANFHEVGKLDYERIIKQFYYTFIDYEHHPDIHLHYLWLHFRGDLKQSELVRYLGNGVDARGWINFVRKIDEIIPRENRPDEFYYINDSGWVYEGRLPEIIRILEDISGLVEDFYILPKREKFDWVLCYCGDGDCMSLYYRE